MQDLADWVSDLVGRLRVDVGDRRIEPRTGGAIEVEAREPAVRVDRGPRAYVGLTPSFEQIEKD